MSSEIDYDKWTPTQENISRLPARVRKHIAELHTIGRSAYTVEQFCKAHGNISRAFFYTLLKEGIGPKTFKLKRRTMISVEAAAEWRAKMESS